MAAAFALLVAWQWSTIAPGLAASARPGGRRPSHPDARSAFARSIGVARSRVRLGVQIQLHDGVPARLWIVRGRTSSDVCASIQVGSRRQLASACGGAAPAAGSIGILIGPTAGSENSTELVGGVAARSTSHVRLGFGDSTTMLVAVRSGAWLAQIPSTPGHARLRSIAALGISRDPSATQDVGRER
jgi:hypothetical protein